MDRTVEDDLENQKAKNTKIIYPELSYNVVGSLFEVYNQIGPGFTEDIYETALQNELRARNIPFERQKLVNVYYKGEVVGNYRMDLIIDGKIILELKAVTEVNDIYKAQLISYLRATGIRLGILVNFGGKQLYHKRIVV